MVFIPKEVAEAIESVWATKTDDGTVKYLWLNNWSLLEQTHPEQYFTLLKYAKDFPVTYMQALTQGYKEFDKELTFNNGGVTIGFCEHVVDDENFMCNTPILATIGAASEMFSIEDAKNLSDNLLILIQELDKVRSEI